MKWSVVRCLYLFRYQLLAFIECNIPLKDSVAYNLDCEYILSYTEKAKRVIEYKGHADVNSKNTSQHYDIVSRPAVYKHKGVEALSVISDWSNVAKILIMTIIREGDDTVMTRPRNNASDPLSWNTVKLEHDYLVGS